MTAVQLNALRPCLAAAVQRSSTAPSYPSPGSDPSVGHVYFNESQQHYTPPPAVHGAGGMFGGFMGAANPQPPPGHPGMYGAFPPQDNLGGPSEADKEREIE